MEKPVSFDLYESSFDKFGDKEFTSWIVVVATDGTVHQFGNSTRDYNRLNTEFPDRHRGSDLHMSARQGLEPRPKLKQNHPEVWKALASTYGFKPDPKQEASA